MAMFEATPDALAIACPRCKRPPLSRCVDLRGLHAPTHVARKNAAAQEDETG